MAEKKNLKTIVGQETYGVWVDMLRRLVPEGRTHRLAPMIEFIHWFDMPWES
jgi:hypothetical protein